jgi:aspartate 1-decarboxylase
MQVHLLRSKILRAEVTDARLDYEGSLAIDSTLMERVGILQYERILVGNLANGNRFETYAIPAPAGSLTCCLNGAAAHLGKKGDLLVIMTFGAMTETEAKKWQPRTIVMADANRRIVKETNPVVRKVTGKKKKK